MKQNSNNPEDRDPRLWSLAKKRAGFKRALATYIIVHIFLWAIWLLSYSRREGDGGIPWPVWPMLGWGIGLLFQYAAAYKFPRETAAEKEYKKLKDQQP